MTRFTVVWDESARDELANLWMAAPDRNAVTQASNAIDAELAEDPDRKGAPLSEGLRGLSIPPLRVVFLTRKDDRIVEVLRVARL